MLSCPRCKGQVLSFYKELSCLQCGWYPGQGKSPPVKFAKVSPIERVGLIRYGLDQHLHKLQDTPTSEVVV